MRFRVLLFSLLFILCFYSTGCGRIWSTVNWNGPGGSGGVAYFASQLGAAGKVTEGTFVTFDSSNNSYIEGITTGSPLGGAQGTQYGANGTQDAYIAKFDNSGNFIWSSQLGQAGQSQVQSGIGIDPAGNLYGTGYTDGTVLGGAQGFQYGAHGVFDLFAMKFNSAGVLQWARQLGLAGNLTFSWGGTTDSSGNSYGVGSTSGTVLGGAFGTQQGVHGTNDGYIAKFDTNGNLTWVTQLGIAGQVTTNSDTIIDGSGNLYTTGSTGGTVLGGGLGAQYGVHGNEDVTIYKSGPAGNLIWVRQLGIAAVNTVGSGVGFDSSGNLYVLGQTAGSVLGGAQGLQYGTHGTQDIFLAKFDSTGNFLWSRQLGLAGNITTPAGISVDSLGTSYVNGNSTGSVLGGALGTQYGTHGTNDAFTAKFDTNGNLIWVSQIGSAGVSTNGSGITLNSLGSLFVVGQTAATLGTQFGAHGSFDAILFQMNPSTGAYP